MRRIYLILMAFALSAIGFKSLAESTVYFLYDDQGAGAPTIYYWGGNSQSMDWGDQTKELTLTGKACDLGGTKYAVWSYSFAEGKEPEQMIFRKHGDADVKLTKNLKFQKDGVYNENCNPNPLDNVTPADFTEDYYLAGTFNGWSANDTKYKFTPVEGQTAVYTLNLESLEKDNLEFKVVLNGSWKTIQGTLRNGYCYKLGDGNNATLYEDLSNVTLTLEVGPTNYLTVTPKEWPSENESKVYFVVANQTEVKIRYFGKFITDADWDNDLKMTKTGKVYKNGSETYDVWSYNFPGNKPTGIMFGYGNDQTSELAYMPGGVYGTSGFLAGVTPANFTDPDPVVKNYYLAGDVSGWANNSEDFKFIPVEGKDGVYTLNVASLSNGFKITDGTWDNPLVLIAGTLDNGFCYELKEDTWNNAQVNGTLSNVTLTLELGPTNYLTVTPTGWTAPAGDESKVYFVVTDQSEVKIHYFGKFITDADWNNDPKLTKTGKVYKNGGVTYDVWSYPFPGNKPTGIMFRYGNDQTSELAYMPGGVYGTDGFLAGVTSANFTDPGTDPDPVPVPGAGPETVEYGTPNSVTFFFHAKNDYLSYGDPDFVPRAYLILDGDTKTELGFTNGVPDGREMIKVEKSFDQVVDITDIQLYRVTFKKEDVDNAHDIIFGFVNKKDPSRFDSYRAKAYPSSVYEMDEANWTKYIYSTRFYDKTSTNYAVQTYLTFDKFISYAKGYPDKLYLVGNFDNSSFDINNKVIEVGTSEAGLFFCDLGSDMINLNSNDARFKISWLDPRTDEPSHFSGETEEVTKNARRWATFDLGIIGLDDQHDLIKNNTNVDFILGTDADVVKNALLRPFRAVPYNNLNQFNWYIQSDFSDAKYLVVDMNPNYKTVSVIKFMPNPDIESVTFKTTTTYSLNPTQREQLGMPSFKGSEKNGRVRIDQVNAISGQIDVPVNTDLIENNTRFDVEVEPWMNGHKLGKFKIEDGNYPIAYKLNFLTPDGDKKDEVGLRYIFTSKDTGLRFRSYRPTESMVNELTFNNPEVLEIGNRKYINYGVWGVATSVKVKYPVDNYLVMYADYEVQNGDHPFDYAMLIDKNHWMAHPANTAFDNDAAHDQPWEQWDGQGEYDDAKHNWAKLFATENAVLPLYIHNVESDTSKKPDSEKSFEFRAIAAYPFLVNPEAVLEPVYTTDAQAVKRRAASTTPYDGDLTGFQVNMANAATPATITVHADTPTAVTEIAADDFNDTDAEYYTLLGVRVTGNPAPGIYLCRRGNTTTKVFVR